MRRTSILAAVALLVVFALPRAASAQAQAHCYFFNSTTPCRAASPMGAMPLAWKNITFGPATFVKAAPKKYIQVTGVPGGAHAAHRAEPSVGVAATANAIAELDCAMARVGDMSLDPKFVQAPTIRPTGHGGVALPAAAPCSQLKTELPHSFIRR